MKNTRRRRAPGGRLLAATVIVLSMSRATSVPAAPSQAVHFSLDQPGGLTPAQIAVSIEQVRLIWRSSEVEVTAGRYGTPAPAGAVTVSLRLVGASQVTADGTPVLGWVVLSPTERPVPMVFVSIRQLMEFLARESVNGRPFGEQPKALRDTLVARATGRIIAHELDHSLLQSARHDRTGLLRPHYSARDLMGPWLHPFEVSPGDQSSVRFELTKLYRLQAVASAGGRGER